MDGPTEGGIVSVVKASGCVGIAYWGDMLNWIFADGRDSSLQGNHCKDGDEDQEDSLMGDSYNVCLCRQRMACAATSSDGRAQDKSSGSDEDWWEEDNGGS